jgi:ribosomal protein L29
MTANLIYESDFYRWTVDQVANLRLGKLDDLDLENLAEEIESLGNQQRSELENRLAVLLGHLLKWDLQPALRGKSWRSTIKEQRRQIQRLITKNPSLKSYLDEAISEGYESALDLVVRETPLDYQDLPQVCPYAIAQIFDNNFPVGVEMG